MAAATLPYFNSIKVRLELAIACLLVGIVQSFQFHKGTIRTLIRWIPEYEKAQFQFHKGTIRTGIRELLDLITTNTFQFHKGTIRTRKRLFGIGDYIISIP